jgi:hypothetical protein
MLSERMLRVGGYLPFVGILAFALLGLYTAAHGPSRGDVSIPSLSILQDQRAFLISQGLARGLNVDFLLFEALIFASSIVGLLRFLTGVLSIRALDAMGTKAEAYAKAGKSSVGFFFFSLILMPFTIFFSLHFAGIMHSIHLRTLMEISPRSFICLSTFVFCGSVTLFVEGLLTLAWVTLLAE